MKRILTLCTILLTLAACDNAEFGTAPECKIEKVNNQTLLTCNGETLEIKDGENGADGRDGIDGQDGVDGNDGQNGADGQDGTSGLFVDIIDPCGQETQFDEVILVTRDGQFIAYFAQNGSANKSRLTILDENITYTTTDGTNCKFKITNGVLID